MPCRIGITTRPEERKQHWRNRVVGFKNWSILSRHNSRKRAQVAENRFAKNYGCKAHAGGPSAAGRWHVYYFEYTRMKSSSEM